MRGQNPVYDLNIQPIFQVAMLSRFTKTFIAVIFALVRRLQFYFTKRSGLISGG